MKLTRYKLGELIDVRRGASLSGEYYATEGDLIRLTLGNFDYQCGGFKDNTSKNDLYFVGPVKQEFILSEGDIITPLTEQTPGLLGSTAQIPVSEKYIQSQDVALIIPDESKLDKDFCYYLLPSKIAIFNSKKRVLQKNHLILQLPVDSTCSSNTIHDLHISQKIITFAALYAKTRVMGNLSALRATLPALFDARSNLF